MRIFPAIDIKDGRCVRLTQGRLGTETVYSEDPVSMARLWESRGAEIIHVVDLDGAFTGKPRNRDLILQICEAVSIPIQVAGGLRTHEDIEGYLKGGADRVVLGTKVVTDFPFLEKGCETFPMRISVGLDARNEQVVVQGWTESTSTTVLELAKQISSLRVLSIIFTDIQRDGMLEGPNLDAIQKLSGAVSIPIIASGGVTTLDDLKALMNLAPPGVAGAIIGKALYNGVIRLEDAMKLTVKNPNAD
ncbi:MAG TPA: 1-(5-phosphoribosyl)-5-[(5-phosphoribosylamino)methylideneamino]imidazole-4-carboxamide isomerase [Nitrospiria bacterium]|nr:1-(5-phosphoribosyl)-5-[(5-phosphoribosylamino)methylideneamino]imidazole-4-carboxamide isomerase [Nitrospiria bacterium]